MKNILKRDDRASILARVSRVRPDTPRAWGRMSAHGMVCHLTDSFAACLGDLDVSDQSRLVDRTVIRLIAVTLPVPWPKGVPTMPEVDQEVDGTPPGDFAADVARLKAVTEDFAVRLDPRTARHPLFGRMTAAEWGRWGYRHLDHHARQFGL